MSEITEPVNKTCFKRVDLINKYRTKKCVYTNAFLCTVDSCSLAHCDRVQAYSDAGKVSVVSKQPVKKAIDVDSMVDRLCGSKKKA